MWVHKNLPCSLIFLPSPLPNLLPLPNLAPGGGLGLPGSENNSSVNAAANPADPTALPEAVSFTIPRTLAMAPVAVNIVQAAALQSQPLLPALPIVTAALLTAEKSKRESAQADQGVEELLSGAKPEIALRRPTTIAITETDASRAETPSVPKTMVEEDQDASSSATPAEAAATKPSSAGPTLHVPGASSRPSTSGSVSGGVGAQEPLVIDASLTAEELALEAAGVRSVAASRKASVMPVIATESQPVPPIFATYTLPSDFSRPDTDASRNPGQSAGNTLK